MRIFFKIFVANRFFCVKVNRIMEKILKPFALITKIHAPQGAYGESGFEIAWPSANKFSNPKNGKPNASAKCAGLIFFEIWQKSSCNLSLIFAYTAALSNQKILTKKEILTKNKKEEGKEEERKGKRKEEKKKGGKVL